MIPKIIHYCWFGRGEMPQLVLDCIASWHKFMPDWEYKLWNEDNCDINIIPYTSEAYSVGKYAFVADYVRLDVLSRFGGVYLDTDIMVYKSFEPLLGYHAFGGFEGSKHLPFMGAIMASEPDGKWLSEQICEYSGLHFINQDGSYDMMTNTQRITRRMVMDGFVTDGTEQDYKDMHVFPVDFFSPRQTTGEYIRTDNTYCDHIGANTWGGTVRGLWILRFFSPSMRIRIIKLKRKLLG